MTKQNGKLIIFSAPSGSGKTTLVRHLLSHRNDLAFSVSCCTREAREGETDGKDYYFVSPEEFRQKIENEAFAEWEEVYENHYYGTLNAEIERLWQAGKHVIFDIDVVGGLNLKKKFGDRALAVFVQPPSVEVLEQRLINRNTDSPEKLRMRVDKAKEELTYAPDFDELVINDQLDEAKNEVDNLVENFVKL